ncbi:MAG TPA: calcium-translocating P-type ATPase, SERCA-type [Peptococcaceae bacterium]|nr:MAG: ATPase, E1-E2 type [Moorella sp. 60_41]HBT47291.1 calcium-translocating P-type ATPase, SERCA-type [Peptococcaceae bacterium]
MHIKDEQWHQRETFQALQALRSDGEYGLTGKEARRRLRETGFNQLRGESGVSPWRLLLGQFGDFMVWVLLGATAISLFLGEVADALTIIAIVFLNALLGIIQEYRAERSLEALREMAAPFARVIRDGREQRILARDLVPGDIILVEGGDRVPADALLVWSANLEVEEAPLTGESQPVAKEPGPLPGEVPLAERRNMLYMGTAITRGRGRAVVVATGMATEIGKIAGMIQEVGEEETPLQKRLAQVGRWLVLACLAICGLMVVIGLARGEEPYRMFLVGVSLAVAAIPEGLPAVVTVCLALGVQRMARRRAIVRKLPAVETLGCATVICTDKTGTLTANQMTVRRIWVDDALYEVTGTGYTPHGDILREGYPAAVDGSLALLLKAAALCNNALLERNGLTVGGWFRGGRKKNRAWKISGDPTEGALLVMAAKGGFWREQLEKNNPRIMEIPFDAERKRMSVVYGCRGGRRVYVKGAPDVLLNRCTSLLLEGGVVPLNHAWRRKIQAQNEGMAREALRVLALAYRDLPPSHPLKPEALEENLTFIGLVGMSDPPRPEAREAIDVCRRAGIKVVMITGDHRLTAQAVARELGLPAGDRNVMTGAELEALSDKELASRAGEVAVYARTSPLQKLRIVRALKRNGHVVAMTGDGVNDAPAMKEADIGIAMGRSGTEVAKEAASMILADDNFATIVAAVEEGRGIYSNIRKFIRYLLSCNVGEVLTMFVAAVSGLPLPLLPVQILWINLVTDGLPALALGVDPGEPDLMNRPPHRPNEGIFARRLGWRIIFLGLQIGLVTILVFLAGLVLGEGDLATAQTLAFTTLVFAQLFAVYECRSEEVSPFAVGYFSNKLLLLATTCSALMQVMVIYWPPLQAVFHTVPLNPFHWFLVLLAAGWRTYLGALQYYFLRPLRGAVGLPLR